MLNWENIGSLVKPAVTLGLILLVGHFVIVALLKMMKRGLERGKMDRSLAQFLLKTCNIAFHVLIVLSALNTIGISTTGILAALSAAAVAVAVGLRDSLGNVAGGILLLLSPRFLSGDYIRVEEDEGTVVRVDLLHTTLRTIDNKLISIPNGVLVNSHIVNYTREEKRRVDITFSVSYDADTEQAKQVILSVLMQHPLVLKQPEEPMARVMKYNDSSVDIVTRSWCSTPDYWTVYFDLMEQVRGALERNQIFIPYPRLDVHIKERETVGK